MSERTAQVPRGKGAVIPRGKHHNKTKTKTTVSLYLSKKLVEKAKKQGLNLSRIMENALKSILDYLEDSNKPANLNFTSFKGGIGNAPYGPVVQFGVNAAFARRRSRVQIPPGPSKITLNFSIVSFIIETYLLNSFFDSGDSSSSKIFYAVFTDDYWDLLLRRKCHHS